MLVFLFFFVVLSLSFLGLGPQLYFCVFIFFQLLFASFLHILLLLSSSSIAFLLKVLFMFGIKTEQARNVPVAPEMP